MMEKQSVSQPKNNTTEVLRPTLEDTSPTSLDEHRRKKQVKGERVKAAFNFLDHFLKIYNSSETYITRGIALFGLGSVIAGISFGVGQQINSTQQVNSDHQHQVSSAPTSQQSVNSTSTVAPPPTPQSPSVIYLPIPANQNWTNSTPVKVPTSVSSPAITNQKQAVTSPPVTTQSQPSDFHSVSTSISEVKQPEIEYTKERPPVESVKQSSDNPKSITNDIQELKEVIKDVEQIAAPLEDLF